MWKINILTLFPQIYPGPLSYSTSSKSRKLKVWDIEAKNIRDFCEDKHKTVDGPPYGGGGSMLMRADVLGSAIEKFFLVNNYPIVYLTPKGDLLNQVMAKSIAKSSNGVNIVCGRFEGIDERVIKEYKIRQVSLGDYVVSSGDIAAFVFIDCCLRFIEGYVKNCDSINEESFGENEYKNLLEYPHYTKPLSWKSRKVPRVLTSGHHENIRKWRLDQAENITKSLRPDLWKKYLNGDKNEYS